MGTKVASRLLILVLAAASLAGGGIHTDPRTAPVVVGQGIRVFGADPEHERLVRWAFGRYEHAGLEAPRVDVHFHSDTTGCYGHALVQAGRAETAALVLSTGETLLDEMGSRPDWMQSANERACAAARSAMGDEPFADAWEAGRNLTADEAVSLALEEFEQLERLELQRPPT